MILKFVKAISAEVLSMVITAEKLKVTPAGLFNECAMRDVMKDLGIGTITSLPGGTNGMAAKFRIAELLGIEIKCVNNFKQKVRFAVPAR